MKIGIALWPHSAAQWIELSLSALPDAEVSILGGSQVNQSEPFDLMVIDGDQPGPFFTPFYRDYLTHFGEGAKIILGHPTSPVPMALDWDPVRTAFIPKPYRIEELRHTVEAKFAAIRKTAQALGVKLKSKNQPQPISLGYLSTLRLPDLLQMLCLNHWTGKIKAECLNTGTRGEVYLNVGILIHARTTLHQAEDACLEMLTWGRCEFHFFEEHPPIVQTIQTHWQELLLEGARRFDEKERLNRFRETN